MGRSLTEFRAPAHPRRTRPDPPPRVLDRRPLTAAERASLVALETSLGGIRRPRSLAQCPPANQPCAYLSCRHHLGGDRTARGNIRLTFPGRDLTEFAETCSLRVANRGPQTQEAVGRLLNVTEERICQIEQEALKKLEPPMRRSLEGHLGSVAKRRTLSS